MIRVISPGPRTGTVSVPASKSAAHRLLITAALSSDPCTLSCSMPSRDILATADCLRALGADISAGPDILSVSPISIGSAPGSPVDLFCGESGSTLRFLLPLVGAFGVPAVFHMEGRLPERPLSPLDQVLTAHGMSIHREGSLLFCEGRLHPGSFEIPGNVSSQYVSGLLFALPLLEQDSLLQVTGRVESADYIVMTEQALQLASFCFDKDGWNYRIPGNQSGRLPPSIQVERDWSSAAFFLCEGALSPTGVTVEGLDPSSAQGDKSVLSILSAFGAEVSEQSGSVTVRRCSLNGIELDASAIPDLVPVLSVVASVADGETIIRNAERLRIKESDRLMTTAAMLSALGADIRETEDGLVIRGRPALQGGTVSSFRDHRIAMSAAVAASVCASPVRVNEAECTDKSFPGFWDTLYALEESP